MFSVWTVFKKEIFRVFSDPRLILTVFIIPGLSIFLIYSLMGGIISREIDSAEAHVSIIYIEHMPQSLEPYFEQTINYDLYDASNLEVASIEEKTKEGSLDLALLFDPDFDQKVSDLSSDLPEITVYYNQGEQHSARVYNQFNHVLNSYHEAVVIERLNDPSDYQVFTMQSQNIVDERVMAAQGFAMLLPMLVVIFLFAGAMAIGPDAIAGEKERGTIATLLVTPIKRRDFALGKVISLSVLALLSALSSFVGVVLSLPRLMMMDDTLPDVSIYGIVDYTFLLLVLMSTVIFIVALIAVVSAYAKTIKEASMLIMPFYFLAIIVGVMNSFGTEASTHLLLHLIPLYGPINLLSGILAFNYTMAAVLVTVLANLGYALGLIWVLNLMFNSEKIMFQK